MNTLYAGWRGFQEKFLQYVAAALLLGPTLLAVLEVIRRYVFGVSFEWQQDAVTFGILAGVFLFFAITQSRRAHLRVTVLLLLLREKGGRYGRRLAQVFEIMGAVVGMAFCIWLVWRGIDVAELMILQQRKTESLYFLLWPFFAAFLTSIGFLAVTFAFQLYHEVCVLLGKPGLVDPYEIEAESGSLL
ncbi:MAG: TRAP transporter small permease [Gammaproteobacteria bacterium]|nr:TRAP transporter small permease [Gammaproteobacteria bacterium]